MSGERSVSTGELDLDAALRDLGLALVTPAAAGVAGRVRARIEAERPRRAAVPWWRTISGAGSGPGSRSATRPLRRSLLLAAAALLLIAAAVTAAIGYGLPGIRILLGPPASPTPATASQPPSAAPGATIGLGTPLTLDEARRLVDFEVVLPSGTGDPDAVYLAGRRLALVWAPGPGLPGTDLPGVGLLLMEVHAGVDQVVIDKLIDAGTAVEPVTVGGSPGYWIAGERHQVAYVAPDGSRIEDSVRMAGNTLLWTAGGITYRLEGELGRDEAIALGETLR